MDIATEAGRASTRLRIQRRLFEILEAPPENDPASRLVNRLLAVLILANIAAVILESVGTLNENEGSQLSIRSARSKHGWARLTFYRGLAKVGGEMSLHALAYNLKQVMKIMGTRHLVAALRA